MFARKHRVVASRDGGPSSQAEARAWPGTAEVRNSAAGQGQGLGITMFNQLIEIARKRGIVRFTADVLHNNARMLHIFHKCAPNPIKSTLESGVYHLSFSIEPGV